MEIKLEYDNPASRLLQLLITIKAKPIENQCRLSFYELFELENPPQSDFVLFEKLGKIGILANETVNLYLKFWPNKKSANTYWVSCVQRALSNMNLNSHLNTFTQHIDERAIESLTFCADALDAKLSNQKIEAIELQFWKGDLQTILDAIVNSNVSEKVKLHLSRCIRRIIEAIDEYRINGSEAILEAIDMTFGRMAIDVEYQKFLREGVTDTGVKFTDIIGGVANSVTVALGLPPLIEIAKPALDVISNIVNS